jgi:hypothetical protein
MESLQFRQWGRDFRAVWVRAENFAAVLRKGLAAV